MTGSASGIDGPGLVAAALYLRPSRRAEAVGAMVELGMFVREFQTSPTDALRLNDSAELSLIFASPDPTHIRVVERLADGDRVVAVVLPGTVAVEPFARAGAMRVLREDDSPAEIRAALSYCGHLARQRRGNRMSGDRKTTIFGGLEFHPAQRWLSRGETLTSLSPPEHGVLRALVTAGGSVVPKAHLQRELTGTEDPASAGYLKTVVLRIRRKVELMGGDPGQLTAVRGAGYVLRPNRAATDVRR